MSTQAIGKKIGQNMISIEIRVEIVSEFQGVSLTRRSQTTNVMNKPTDNAAPAR
ncbi:MAG: hypothetical protein ACE361_05460 [Aureliella sp.]